MLDALIAGFHDIHRQRFSYANPGSPVEIVSLRVSAIGRLPKAEGKAAPVHSERKPARHRKVWMGGAWREIAAWSRGQIAPEPAAEGTGRDRGGLHHRAAGRRLDIAGATRAAT